MPGYLVRGKVVNFRCKRCRGIIEVDGRALKPISTPPPAPDSMGDSSMRLSISDGVLFERPSSEPPPRISSTPPPPMFPSEVPARRSSDSFTPRRVQVDPHLASQATFSTAPPTAVAVSESPASAALRSDRPPPADAGKRTKRVVGVSAVVVALGLTAWGLAAREL
ncbi:MAG TPA: hypothetical protein VJT73_20715, partial [Polyangiaceae bacterium]|nr:hypothetical protein [Polyangiaceae bacterium]